VEQTVEASIPISATADERHPQAWLQSGYVQRAPTS
jgi:hypothetical protein